MNLFFVFCTLLISGTIIQDLLLSASCGGTLSGTVTVSMRCRQLPPYHSLTHL